MIVYSTAVMSDDGLFPDTKDVIKRC